MNLQFHDLYSKLDYNISMLYADLSPRAFSLIIRARDGMQNINARSFNSKTDSICTICNVNAQDNIFNFIGTCPIYKDFREKYIGNSILNLNDVININGNCFKSLHWYLESS